MIAPLSLEYHYMKWLLIVFRNQDFVRRRL